MTTVDEQDKAFLDALEREIGWEWKYEKRHRRWGWGINWTTWFARLSILALAFFQLTAPDVGRGEWVFLTIAVLAMLNVALPLLSYSFRFQQRQEVHDGLAREYEALKVEYLSGQLALAEAVESFGATRRQPTERLIRGTP